MSFNFTSASAIGDALAARAKAARLARNLSRDGLAARAGVTSASLKRFESTGQVSLDGLIKIAIALRMEESFDDLFKPKPFTSIDEVLAQPVKRQRGRRA